MQMTGILKRSIFVCTFVWSCFTVFMPNLSYGAETRISTATGAGADTEVPFDHKEAERDLRTGEEESLAIRHYPAQGEERNEVVLLRFDLTGINSSDIRNARLELTSYSPLHKNGIIVYGRRHDADNQRWDERGVKFSTGPGLAWDRKDFSVRGLDDDRTIKLGVMAVPAADEGVRIRFTSEKLKQFLQDSAWSARPTDPNLVTFILMLEKESRGQRRFCSKEFEDHEDESAPLLVLLTR